MTIQEIADKFDLSKKYPNYFKKWIFRSAFIIIGLLLVLIYITNGTIFFKWVECNSDKECLNPFYICQEIGETNCIWSVSDFTIFDTQKYIKPHEVLGNKPNWIGLNFTGIVLFLIINAFGINHLLWRK